MKLIFNEIVVGKWIFLHIILENKFRRKLTLKDLSNIGLLKSEHNVLVFRICGRKFKTTRDLCIKKTTTSAFSELIFKIPL